MARPTDCVKPFVNAAAGTVKFQLLGGIYCWDFVGTGSGTVDLKRLMPDGTTYLAVATQITATTGTQTSLYLPPGSYEAVIATFTANYLTITRLDVA